jgi:two-component system OmpR family sensor kinase
MAILQRIKSVRFVLTLWYSVVLVAAFLLFGFGVFVYLRQLEKSSLEEKLTEEVNWIASLIDLERARVPSRSPLALVSEELGERILARVVVNPSNYLVMLADSTGSVVFRSRKGREEMLPLDGLPQGETVVRSVPGPERGHVLVAIRRGSPFTIEVAYTERLTEAVLEHLLLIFLVMAPVALFLSVAGGWFLAGLVLRPIRQISLLANRITAENLNQRIPPRAIEDELGELINTINGMIQRLQGSFDQMREFSMNVAHELKTPLTILKGESELALGRAISQEEAVRLATIYLEETVRMSRIVEDLLTLAKAEANQIRLENELVRLDELISDLYEDAQGLAVTKNLRVELVRNEMATVRGDVVRLRQLFRAILSNAVQYTNPQGLIRLSSSQEGRSAVVEIEDTGIGIPPESLERIFDRFYRVDEARSRVLGGSGLGLAIAKWVAEAHGGSITVRSTVGMGSCFTVRLPLAVS